MRRSSTPARQRIITCLAGLTVFFITQVHIRASEPTSKPRYEPPIAPESREAERAAKSIKVAKDLKVEVFAAEPKLANPVAFGFDEAGRVYVVETFRLHKGVTDNRSHMYWLDDDIACQTVEDRIALYRKHLGAKISEYETEHDRLRLLEDTDGDGRADRSTVFADGFNRAEDGLAAGVLARRGEVWFTCIPELWHLRDNDGDGKADVRKSLHHGYGVHVSFIGHDLHGLRFGPDGKLYFSVGDRGLNVKTADRAVVLPDTGAVLRCNPDGSELELYATGLRNPQELAFDKYGNLFTCDNNSDSGDRARWVYVVEGGDSGWRIGYQYIESPVSRGPWNAERLWNPRFDGQAAYIVPPLLNLADGPSGLTVDPGVTLLPERYRGQFFLCDFRGSTAGSGVRAIAVKPKGASFEVTQNEQFAWGFEATDVDFGPDGGLYVCDWVEGWDLTGKGRLFKISDPRRVADPGPREVKALLRTGMTNRSNDELEKLLSHADARVRQEAQFSLAERGQPAVAVLERVAKGSTNQLARIHALWGLGQVGRTTPGALNGVVSLLSDRDGEVRAQAAKTVGDQRVTSAAGKLIDLLKDENPRVRFFAAISLGKVGGPSAIAPLAELLRSNADKDAFLRHAAVMGLVKINDPSAVLALAGDSSAAVRMGVLLALRRFEHPEIARFLDDARPELVLEAARAIYDVPITPAIPKLAALGSGTVQSQPLLRRVVNALARTGRPEDANGLAALAARTDAPAEIRVEAVERLNDWGRPIGRDPVMGLWRPRPALPTEPAAAALKPVLAGLVRGGPEALRLAALRAVGSLPINDEGDLLWDVFNSDDRTNSARVEALRALERTHDRRLPDAVSKAVNHKEDRLRIEGQKLLAKLDPVRALPLLTSVIERGTTPEKQMALATVGELAGSPADELLARWLDRLDKHQVPAEIELDLLEAARKRKASAIAEKLKAHDEHRPKDDPLAQYREALVGGNAQRGWQIVSEKAEVSCVRCHKVRGRGGEVGPNLAGIGKRQDRRYLLEALVAPGRQVAKGFENTVVAMKDAQVHSGVVKSDDKTTLTLITAEAKTIKIPKADIEEQKRGGSAMPDDVLKHLSKSELRDVVEFLANQK